MPSDRRPIVAPLSRRALLGGALGLTVTGGFGRLAQAAGGAAAERILVLLELNGGNDSLNMVVPYADPAYRRARPGLAIGRDAVAQLDERLGLNRALEPLMPSWQGGELAVALGVGYPRPNRSHFRSIEIWNSASDSEQVITEGWVNRLFAAAPQEGGAGATDAVVLGGPSGPLLGPALRTVVMRQPERFLQRAANVGEGAAEGSNPALDHILGVRSDVTAAAEEIEAHLERAPKIAVEMPEGRLGRQLENAARLILAGVPLSAIKVAQSGYDTHAGQAGRQRKLLTELSAALAAFRAALIQGGAWDRVLVMTYAEFGRRVAENASGGTDHGTAAAHLVLGGRVRGGLIGEQPSLTALDGGDLRHRLDFRRLYATAAHRWWSLPQVPGGPFDGFAPLDLIAA